MNCRTFVLATCYGLIYAAECCGGTIGVGDFPADSTIINFDNLAGGSSVNTGDVITNQYAGAGIVFNNPDYPLRANHNPIASEATIDSAPNVAFARQHDGSVGRPLKLTFEHPMSMLGMKFFTSPLSTFTLSVFDSSNALIESVTVTGQKYSAPDLLEGFVGLREATPIASAQLSSAYYNGDVFNFSIDDVEFHGVPEPSTLILAALGGLAGLVVAKRSARR
jgi:hypothetical protein